MIFGDKFYLMLKKMSPWQQSLFALVLAQRQFPNYALWADVNKVNNGRLNYQRTLEKLWEFHKDKFNTIDLEKVLDDLEPFLLDDTKEDLSVGDLFSLDASITISASILAIILHEGEESTMASYASLAGVVRKIENQTNKDDYTDEQLREMSEIDDEVNFQVEVVDAILNSKRDAKLYDRLYKMAYNNGISNIGIALED